VKETAQQYTQRILGYIEGQQPLAVQAATTKKLPRALFACESHNQRGSAKRPKSVEITGESAPDPKYEHSEPNRL
jgi:hypothetical protein